MAKKTPQWMHGGDLSGEEMATILGEFANVMGNDRDDAFIKQLTLIEHRTIQANVFRMFLRLAAAWAQLPDDRIDMRNENVRLMCREIIEKLGGALPPHI